VVTQVAGVAIISIVIYNFVYNLHKIDFRMPESFSITVNGRPMQVDEHTSVAAALMMAGEPCRRSVRDEPRAPFCGMGVCMECRATVNGVQHRRTCQLLCTPEMDVVTE
jgi:sarcosine oxidase subunit alpha